MQSFKEAIPFLRHVSELLDQLTASVENDTPHHDRITTLCPFCNKAMVRVELTEGINMFNEGVKIGFFACTACGQDWSNQIDI